MELRIIKPSFKYTSGQWLFIQVPDVSSLQWHPVSRQCPTILMACLLIVLAQFTITSAPEDPYVSVHIRQVGDWTQGLGERIGVGPSVVSSLTMAAMKGSEKEDQSVLGAGRGDFVEFDPSSSTQPLPSIRIDGPYGAPAEDVFDSEVAVLVGAGIGA
jgi:NADPH oxidase